MLSSDNLDFQIFHYHTFVFLKHYLITIKPIHSDAINSYVYFLSINDTRNKYLQMYKYHRIRPCKHVLLVR